MVYVLCMYVPRYIIIACHSFFQTGRVSSPFYKVKWEYKARENVPLLVSFYLVPFPRTLQREKKIAFHETITIMANSASGGEKKSLGLLCKQKNRKKERTACMNEKMCNLFPFFQRISQCLASFHMNACLFGYIKKVRFILFGFHYEKDEGYKHTHNLHNTLFHTVSQKSTLPYKKEKGIFIFVCILSYTHTSMPMHFFHAAIHKWNRQVACS